MLNMVMKPHRTYLKAHTSEPQALFVMLRFIPEGQVAQTRSSISLALVIDTSSSMRDKVGDTTKLEQAIQAAHRLIDDPNLREGGDKITIIQFDDESRVLLPLSPLARKQAHAVVDSLRNYAGGTQMGRGMQNALTQLRREPIEAVKRMLLLTDGETFDEDLCQKLVLQFAETNTPILSIGIGEEYNQDLLINLADTTKGRHLHLTDMQQLGSFFAEEVRQVVREVVTDVQLKVAGVKGVTLEGISRVYPSLAEVPLGSQPYRLGNIVAGDYTVFILNFKVGELPRPPSRVRLAQFNVWASVPGLQQRQIELPPQELFVTFTQDEQAVAQVDQEVMHYVMQRNVDHLFAEAIRLVNQGKTEEARKTLQRAQQMTQQVGNLGMTRLIQGAMEELNRTGTISANTQRTLRAGGRTMTVKSKQS